VSASAEHLSAAERHFRSAGAMIGVGEYNWASVALFYSAMHLVHAVLPVQSAVRLAPAQQHPENHTGRDFLSEGTNVIVRTHFRPIDNMYKSLYQESLDVRYGSKVLTLAEAQGHVRYDLSPIADWACLQVHTQPCQCWMTSVGL
jgi:hypothetical protein